MLLYGTLFRQLIIYGANTVSPINDQFLLYCATTMYQHFTLVVFDDEINFALLLFYTIATVFQLYLGSYMMYEMRRRKAKHIILPIQGIFNLPHYIGLV